MEKSSNAFCGTLKDLIPVSNINLTNSFNNNECDQKLNVKLYETHVNRSFTPFNEHMIKCLNKIKNELFDPLTFKYWNNVVICGGYVLDLLYNIEKSSDVDLYIYKVKDQSTIDEIANYIIRLTKGKVIHESKGVMTIRTKNNKSVQIINTGNKQSISDILNKFDINICKVAFDGYQIIVDPSSVSEIRNRTIVFNGSALKHQTAERIGKYVHKKQFGLLVEKDTLNNVNPLYLFRESHGFDKFMQLSKLLQDYTLQNIYKLLVIRTNFDSNNLNAMVKYATGDKLAKYDDSQHEETALTGKSLTSYIKEKEFYDMNQFNQFGQPKLFEAIRKGNYTPNNLYGQQISDMCGFNTTCMMVLFEPDEHKVIAFLKDIYKVGSKNMNQYKINYLTMSSLLSRLDVVSYLMNSTNYRDVMKIAMKEDNLELYKLAYCTHSSKDRYLFSKEELLKYSAFSIYEELYGTDDINQNVRKNVSDDYTQYLKDITVDEFIVKYSKMGDTEKNKIKNFLIANSVKEIKCTDATMVNEMSTVEIMLYNIQLDKINHSTKIQYNKLLKNILSQDSYKKHTTVNYENPTKHRPIEYRANLIEIHSKKKISHDYKFDDELINNLIVEMDDPQMVSHTTYKRFLMDMLKNYEVKENLKKYANDHLRKTNDPTLYSEILSNTIDHDLAYSESILNANYVRKENALGYTPCDIITYQTLRDYANNYGVCDDKYNKYVDPHYSSKNLVNRRKSVRNINRNLPIIPYTGTPTMDAILKLLPELDVTINHIRSDPEHNDINEFIDEEEEEEELYDIYTNDKHKNKYEEEEEEEEEEDEEEQKIKKKAIIRKLIEKSNKMTKSKK